VHQQLQKIKIIYHQYKQPFVIHYVYINSED